MKIIFPKPTKKRQEKAGVGSGGKGGGFRVLYLLLTNEPSNYKEWVREASREGMRSGEGRGQGRGNVKIRKKMVEKERLGEERNN